MKARLLIKVLLWIVAACCAVVVALYLIALFVNRNDQPPSKSVVRFDALVRALPPVADKDNGFISFLGISAEKGRDAEEVGIERITWARERLKRPGFQGEGLFPGKTHEIAAGRSSAVEKLFEKCKDANLTCVRALRSSEAEIQKWLVREDWFAQRYNKLQTYPQWRETLQFDGRLPFAPYSHLLEGQKMQLLNAWMRAGRGDAAGVKKILESDIRFWRRNLAHSGSLIAKMIAGAALRNHFAWSNIILRRLPADAIANTIPSEWRVPISDEERSMELAFIGEWRYFTSNLKQAKGGNLSDYPDIGKGAADDPLSKHLASSFLQLQDTSNQHAEHVAQVLDAFSVRYAQLPAAVERSRNSASNIDESMFSHGLYNVIGHILLRAGKWDMTQYALRIADLEGVRRASLLAAELRSRNVPIENIQDQLAAPSIGSPYDGAPLSWDAQAQSIVFIGLGDGKYRRMAVLY